MINVFTFNRADRERATIEAARGARPVARGAGTGTTATGTP